MQYHRSTSENAAPWQPRHYGGRRRGWRARASFEARAGLRCPWAGAGPGRASRRNDETTARQISHAIPPRHDPTQAQKPQNINDQISKPEILSGELHAKLMGERPVGPQAARPTHQQAMQRPEHPWGRKQPGPRAHCAAPPTQPGTHTAHTARGPKRRSASGPHAHACQLTG